MKVGDLVKHKNDGDIGIVVKCDDDFYSYKVTWPKWSTTGLHYKHQQRTSETICKSKSETL
jgi:hypothetical protein